jgi:hypothetical protein
VSIEGPCGGLPMGITLLDLPGLFDIVESRSLVALEHMAQCSYIWIVSQQVNGTIYMDL